MWTQPEIRTYNEEELLKSMEVKAQYHEDANPHEDASIG